MAVLVEIAVLGTFLELVSGTSPGTGTDRATDESSGWSGNRATDESATDRATGATGATDLRAALVVAFGSLTCHGPAGRADRATDSRAYRSTDHAAHRGPTYGARRTADGLGTVLVVAVVLMVVRLIRHGTGVWVVEIAIPIVYLMKLLHARPSRCQRHRRSALARAMPTARPGA